MIQTAGKKHRSKRLVTTFMKNLHGAGAERIAVNLITSLPRDVFEQQLVTVEATGAFAEQIPADVPTVDLNKAGNVSAAVLPLARYLKREKPDVLISHLAHANVAAVAARALAGVETKVVLIEHNDNSVLDRTRKRSPASRALQRVKAAAYQKADAIVGVSHGVARHVEAMFGLPHGHVKTIYNPVVNDAMLTLSREVPKHPWFGPGLPPVLLAGGRLRKQKDFITLLHAFSRVVQERPCRLVIMGEGREREALEAEVVLLGLQDKVDLPGFINNPYALMRHASAFVLSSRWEGLPTVLIEAMACGCPVVATDCPSGPHEILQGGRWGKLVKVADPHGMAEAILETLNHPKPSESLEARAATFSHDRSIQAYRELLTSL